MSCPKCGGDGTKFVSQCEQHQAETLELDARRMGVADLMMSVEDPELLTQIKAKLQKSLSGYVLVKVTP